MNILLDDVSVYLGGKKILKNINFSLPPGLNFVLGLNGSGKTTLLRCLSKSVPFTGEVLIGEKSLREIPPDLFSKTVSIVHQKWFPPFRISLKDFVLMGRFPYLNWLGSYSKKDLESVDEEMCRMKIDHLKSRFIDQVSGGELQRVFICRALVQQCPVILLDEPAQSLDPPGKREIYQLLVELADQGKTLICTTHDIDVLPLAHSYCIGIREGEVVLNEKVLQLSPEVLTQIYAK